MIRPWTSDASAGALDDRGLVLGDDDLAGLAEQLEADALELQADLFRDDLAAGEDRDVLEHRLAALAEAGGLDGDRLERAADLVDDERGEGLALDVLGDDRERTTALHDLLEHRQQVLDRRDLRAHEEHVGVVEDGLHALGVGHEVRRDVALVEAHALDEVELHAEGLALLDGDDAVGADLLERLGDHRADLLVGRRDGGDVGDLRRVGLRRSSSRVLMESTAVDDRGLDALLQDHRVRAGRDVAQALADHRPREHGCGRRAVTGDVVGLLGDFLDELGADLLVRVFEVDLLGDRDAVVRDRGRAPLLLEDDVAALRAEGDSDGVGELVHARFERPAGLLGVGDLLGHTGTPWGCDRGTERLRGVCSGR